jgi:hypothetical protein
VSTDGLYERALEVGRAASVAPLREGMVRGVQLTSLADVEMRRAQFLWEGRMPLGALTIVAGLPGQGKSHLMTWLGARVSRGQLRGDLKDTPADVVVASAEDALSFVLKPRFLAAGADLERVHSVVVAQPDGTDLGIAIPDDLEGLKRKLAGTGSRLLVIDPLLAHIPTRIDGYKDQHVRTALAPLARMAEDLEAAIVCVMHLNKRESADLFSRLGGSGGFLAAARSALLVAPDPSDAGLRIIAHGKSNLSPEADSLAFRLDSRELENPDPADPRPIRAATVVMMGESDHDVEALLRTTRTTARSDATAWLEQALAAGPMPVEWIQAASQEQGHAWRTIERAKSELGVVTERVGGIGGDGRWQWRR